jgi:hypothetical protein
MLPKNRFNEFTLLALTTMKKQYFLIFSFFFLISVLEIEAQQDSCVEKLASFVRNINDLNARFPQEKVYVHFDNTGYFLGESIWFQAYVVTSKLHVPTTWSKVLYVELLSPEGHLIEYRKLKIEEGRCRGDILLKDSLYAGFYEVRAYTRSMLNFGEDVIFSRVFPVFDKPKKEGQYKTKISIRPGSQWVQKMRSPMPALKELNVTFYPEGGQGVTGIETIMAFKVTDERGRGISVEGKIMDARGKEVTTFQTLHQGMGVFSLIPNGEKYRAQISCQGKNLAFELPASISSGYALSVDNRDSVNMSVRLKKTNDLPTQKVGIACTCRGELYYFETVDVPDGQGACVEVPKQYLPSGVCQITLFNSAGEPLAVRLAFVEHPEQALSIRATLDKSSYNPYDSVGLELNVQDSKGRPVETTLSLSVRDGSTDFGGSSTGNIFTDLLLSSDLKGFVETPAYYFEVCDLIHQSALDALMLTQGWQKYDWKRMTGMEPIEVRHPIEPGLLVNGRVTSLINRKPRENVEVKMWIVTSDSLSQHGVCRTDEDGAFNFLLKDFIGTGKMSLQTESKEKRKEMQVLLDRDFSPSPRAYSFFDTHQLETRKIVDTVQVPPQTPEETPSTTEDHQVTPMGPKNQLLKEVIITEKKKENRKSEGLDKADIIYDVEKEMDKMIDNEIPHTNMLFDFLSIKNPYFQFPSSIHQRKDEKIVKSGQGFDGGSLPLDSNYTYKNRKVVFVVNNIGVVDDYRNRELPYLLTMNQIETIAVSEDPIL